ncbi:MAG TPA: apolipoprotein N-acyltransferase, partial [Planctomycetaceae bacterium]|nr:apolipoprotein N-acyltransferase [Planctomycetaceae bacterium]
VRGRYDKRHRVIFGEYIPLQDWFPWLERLTPISGQFGIDAGAGPVVFSCESPHTGRVVRLAPIICFEDTVPHLVRHIVRSAADSGQPVDVLVNLTNDGWFHGSSELDQHLITAIFRSVECRTPMVRAVNTGISAIIDGDGVVREPDVFIDGDADGTEPPRTSMRDPRTGRWYKQLNAALIDTVPLDTRKSFYVRHGDWFAAACCVATIAIGLMGIVLRLRDHD